MRQAGAAGRYRRPVATAAQRMRHVWVNGELVAPHEARLSPFDHGLLVGDGVFETLRVCNGVPFAWRRHIERLVHSAEGLGLPLPDLAELQTEVAQQCSPVSFPVARLTSNRNWSS